MEASLNCSYLSQLDHRLNEVNQPCHRGGVDLHAHLDVLVKAMVREVGARDECNKAVTDQEFGVQSSHIIGRTGLTTEDIGQRTIRRPYGAENRELVLHAISNHGDMDRSIRRAAASCSMSALAPAVKM